MSREVSAAVARWPGPFGGVPPFDLASPAAIETAAEAALEARRREAARIAADPAPPTFANTVEALEAAGEGVRRVDAVRGAFASTLALDGMAEAQARLAPRFAAAEDEIAHDAALFARVEAVHRDRAALPPVARRLTEVVRERLVRRGGALPAADRARLSGLNAAIAAGEARFQRNLVEVVGDEPVWVEDEAELEGLPQAARGVARACAQARGRPDAWAFAALRPHVWPVLQHATSRDLRRRVRDLWVFRCGRDGPHDNRAVAAEVLRLRGEKARLMGYASFAHYATAPRMAGDPQTALAQLSATWAPVLRATRERRDALQALADEDGLGGPLRAWDWLYYAERLRRRRFGLDAEAVKPYLTLENVLAALFDAAGRLHGVTAHARPELPVIHPDVRPYEIRRDGQTLGLVWFDLLQRAGKQGSSWQQELRAAETFRGRVIPCSNVCSNLVPDPDGRVRMGFEYANVLFHEWGHALHMIMSRAAYPSLGPLAVEWDMIELPSLLNERWLFDRDLLRRHARHADTGAPMPDAMIEAVEAAAMFDRVFSVGVEYLAPAIVDLEMHLAADGGEVDPVAIERRVYAELGMPEEVDPVFRVWAQHHSFTEVYAAGVYSYLWADVMVADVIEAFTAAPGGLYDEAVAARWRDTVLTAGAERPGAEAFRAFRGRDPDPDALLRRFALA